AWFVSPSFWGIFFFRASGNAKRNNLPSDRKKPKRPVRGRTNDKILLNELSSRPLATFSSTIARPMSARRPYCTPEGQVVSQERHVRQRSRCRRVFWVGAAPSSTCLTR